MKKICTEAFMVAVAMLLPFLTGSCKDELWNDEQGYVEEGLPATINLKLDVSDMPVMTRSDVLNDEHSHNCENIWIGIYLKSSGERIYSNLFTETADYIEEEGTSYQLSLQATSGTAYIVAVANANACYGLPSPQSNISEEQKLDTLLNRATTWDAFTSICATRSDASDIYQLSYTFPMSGYYSEDKTTLSDDADAFNLKNIKAVNLRGGLQALSGVIRLRRLVSYNHFNISAGDNVTLNVESWQVFNNPYYSYVIDSETNAGDDSFDSNGKTTAYNPSIESTVFTSGDNGSKEFEFFQFENKHTACSYDGAADWKGIRDPERVNTR